MSDNLFQPDSAPPTAKPRLASRPWELRAWEPRSSPDSPPPVRRHGRSSVLAGLGAGVLAALAATLCWSLFIGVSNFTIPVFALMAGPAVGIAVRKAGRGSRPIFGVIGAGCLVASILITKYGGIICVELIRGHNTLAGAVSKLDSVTMGYVLFHSFTPLDVVWYVPAVYLSFKLARRD